MKSFVDLIRLLLLAVLSLIGSVAPALAQDVTIDDPGLDAAIRQALQKPAGPLTQQDMLSLTNLNAPGLGIHSIAGLESARNLLELDLENNLLASFAYPSNFTRLAILNLSGNQLTNASFPGGLTNLTTLIMEGNSLSNLELPVGLTSLASLQLGENPFTNLVLPSDLGSLIVMDLEFDQLTNLTLPAGMKNLNVLALQHNQLNSLTLPPDVTRLSLLLLGGNPLETLVVSEPMATAGHFTNTINSLRNDGVAVLTYPLTVELLRPRPLVGAFQFAITGPPGVYTIFSSDDLVSWSELENITNSLGTISFVDETAHLSPRRFYRARRAP